MKKFEHLAHKIHADEIQPTLASFADFISDLDIDYRPIGSAANISKQWCGDIDLAVEPHSIDRATLYLWLKNNLEYVSNKGVLSALYPIHTSNGSTKNAKVQIDFMFGNPETLYVMYYSPIYGEDCPADSPLKAKHKRILISTYYYMHMLDSVVNQNKNDQALKKVTRWKWSMSRGVELVEEKFVLTNDGWKADKPDRILKTLPNDFATIAKESICEAADPDAFKSCEKLLESLTTCYSNSVAQSVVHAVRSSPDAAEWTNEELDYLHDYCDSLK